MNENLNNNESHKNNKKSILLVFELIIMILAVGGITYAFYNYNRSGDINALKFGNIEFSSNYDRVVMDNVFPVYDDELEDEDADIMSIVITIRGKTDYADGVEYKVSLVDVNNSVGNTVVPITLDIAASGLGSPDIDYYSNRGSSTKIYKVLADELLNDTMIFVGYIPSGSTETNGTVTINAYISAERIILTDTYGSSVSDDYGTTSQEIGDKTAIPTSVWESLADNPMSFKIKVEAQEGIWVGKPLYDLIQSDAVIDNANNVSHFINNSIPGINFGMQSSNTNGKGVYIRSGTENDNFPIAYYRGNVDDNNVVFADKCWKIVRTTDTGGIKLLYNGEYSEKYSTTPLQNESDYTVISNTGNPLAWNDVNKAWEVTVENQTATEIIFAFEEDDDYFLEVEGTSVGGSYGTLRIFNGMTLIKSYWGGFGSNLNMNYDFGSLTANDFIKIYFNGYASSSESITLSVKMTRKGASLGKNCNNLATDTLINDNGYMEFAYATSDYKYDSPAYNGYMYGTVYQAVKEDPVANAVFGNSFVYENNEYKLTSSDVGAATNRHYTCNSTDANAGCESIRYYFRVADNKSYYILISGGKSIETALAEMQENTVDSNVKTKIDNWYAQNIATNTSYTQKIEDTIWCNDRSSSDLGGFNPNSGGLKATLYYSAQDRLYTNSAPSLSCSQNDAFTVNDSRGNRKLTYPVALLTADELTLAGARYGNLGEFYIGNGAPIWTNTPNCFTQNIAYDFYLYQDGTLNSHYLSVTLGLRPSISLKNGTGYITGDGTVNNPYIII